MGFFEKPTVNSKCELTVATKDKFFHVCGTKSMDQLLRDRREEILRVAASHGATDIRLFGSRARGDAGASSDVDLLVKLAPDGTLLDLVAIKQDLEDLLNCPVDVVTEEAISPYIRPQILKAVVTL